MTQQQRPTATSRTVSDNQAANQIDSSSVPQSASPERKNTGAKPPTFPPEYVKLLKDLDVRPPTGGLTFKQLRQKMIDEDPTYWQRHKKRGRPAGKQ